MRVRCHLKRFRGDKSIRDVETESGIARATLSRLENGQLFPLDAQVPQLEEAYGARITDWYDPGVLLELQKDAEAA